MTHPGDVPVTDTGTITDDAPVTDDDGESRSPRKRRREGPARLDIRSVVVSFGGLLAVDQVNVSVEPGTIVGLIGPNGSGKTTLLDTVSGLVAPTEGSVALDGEDLGDYLPEERSALGVVRSFQDCRLYPELSVEDTLLLCEDARKRVSVLSTTLQLPWARRTERDKRRAVDRVIASFGLERFRHHLTGHLSTGTRRVVDLASIVLAGPRLLLLDEPTAGIAQREAEAFIPLLKRLQEVTGSTILLVEHDVPLVFELCSTVIVMQTGTVVVSGSPDVVREDPRALAAYLGASDAALNVTGPGALTRAQVRARKRAPRARARMPRARAPRARSDARPVLCDGGNGFGHGRERSSRPVGTVAAQGDPMGDAQRVAVVVEGVVQGGPVVPEGHGSRLPAVATAELGPLTVPVEHVEQG